MRSSVYPGKLQKLNFWEAGEPRVLESDPEWRSSSRQGGWDAGGETGPEVGDPAAWGGDPGRGPARREIPGAGGWGGSFSESGHR